MNTDLKPGYLTTEFWTTLLMHVLTVVATVMTFTGHTLDKDHFAALIPVGALIGSSVAQLAYSLSRSRTKAAHATAASVASTVLTDVSAVGTALSSAYATVPTAPSSYNENVDSVGSSDGGVAATVLAVPSPTPLTDTPNGSPPTGASPCVPGTD